MAGEGELDLNAKAKLFRRLVIIGGLICFAAMWLPLVGSEGPSLESVSGREAWVPIQDEYGSVCWAWLVVPALALGSDRRRAALAMFVRVVFVVGGVAGCLGAVVLSLVTYPVLLVIVLPPPLLLVIVGLWPSKSTDRGASRLLCVIGLGGLVTACIFADGSGAGVPVLAVGAIVLLCGAVPWTIAARDRNQGEPLPRAIAR